MMPDLLQLTLTLVLVLASIAAAAWLFQAARKTQATSSQSLHIQASIAVGSHERVVLIDVAGKWLLLGVAPGRVNLLAQLEGSAPAASANPVSASDAGSWLATYLGKAHAK